MPELTLPNTDVHKSFVQSVREFHAVGSPQRYLTLDPDRLSDAAEFRAYVQQLLDQRFEEAPRPPGYVPGTLLWWVDGADYLGQIGIRHRLTPDLETAGHIGYDIRPTARLCGHATAMLRAALPVARDLGIERALITCDTDNVGSRKVIEKNGGEFIDEIERKYRFWVPTLPT